MSALEYILITSLLINAALSYKIYTTRKTIGHVNALLIQLQNISQKTSLSVRKLKTGDKK